MTEIEKLQSALVVPKGYRWDEDSPYWRPDHEPGRWLLALVEEKLPPAARHPVVGSFWVKSIAHPASSPVPDDNHELHQRRLDDTVEAMRRFRGKHPRA
jgi:hypothetical protein